MLAISSVGSLKPERRRSGRWSVPTTSSPSTSTSRSSTTPRAHSAPSFDAELRAEAVEAWAAGGQEPVDGGVYWQAIGPRFETPAEIRLMAAHADVVGMTVASECVVAGELGLQYAALCMVDNLANGLGAERLEIADARTRPRRQRGAPARRPRSAAAAARRGRPVSASLSSTPARDGEDVGLRCVDGLIAAIGPEVAAEPGDETIDAGGALLPPRWSTATPTRR